MKKGLNRLIFGIIGLYAVLIIILVVAESGADNASIKGVGDAIWYSIVTLTTVGYGDAYPVTFYGRAVGIILVLCSLGLLSALITGMVTTITGYTLPIFQLKRESRKQWNIFTSYNEVSQIMAEELHQSNHDSISIFFTKGDRRMITIAGESCHPHFLIQGSLRWLLPLHHGKDGVSIFCFGDDVWENYREGRELVRNYKIPVYCRTEMKSDKEMKNLNLYDPVEGLGRFYWTRFPVHAQEKCFIIVGCGDVGGSLFERGLQTNIFQPGRGIHYIVTGDSTAFRKMHYKMCSGLYSYEDRLSFCDSLWDLDPKLIASADRIIICQDKETENLSVYQKLTSHYAISGAVHVYTNTKLQRGHTRTFGKLTDIYTPDVVLLDRRSSMAKQMHELFRKSTSRKTTNWKGLTDFQKQSNIAAADHTLVKCRMLLGDDLYDHLYARNGLKGVLTKAAEVYEEERKDPEKLKCFRQIEHRRWFRFHILYNWEYGPVRDKEKRQHPMLLHFDEIPVEEEQKDDNAWKLIGWVKDLDI